MCSYLPRYRRFVVRHKVVEQLVDEALVKNWADLFRLKKEQVLKLEGFAERSSEKLIAAIQSARKPELYRLIFGLGIRHVGEKAAATLAVREMIDFLMTEKHLSRDDAYMLSSVAADLHITELVDGNKGVHMSIPKNIFAGLPPI